MSLGQRHQSLRREGEISSEKRSKRLVFGIDALVYIMSTLSLVFTIDQVRIIWTGHDVSGVSLLSAGAWSFYGYVHKDKIIIITNALWGVLSLVIVLGVLMYGR
jgi:hypothetical protein